MRPLTTPAVGEGVRVRATSITTPGGVVNKRTRQGLPTCVATYVVTKYVAKFLEEAESEEKGKIFEKSNGFQTFNRGRHEPYVKTFRIFGRCR